MSNDTQSPLIVSVSGIRGVIGESLTPQVLCDFAASYGTPLAPGRVVVSRDGRSSGELCRHAVIAGLLSVGCRVIDIGIASTPSCGYFIKHCGAAGGIQITASHNPPQYNGLKLFRPEGFVLSPQAGEKVAADYRQGNRRLVHWDMIPSVETADDPHRPHLERVLSLVDVAAIRARKFNVVLDANHASGAVFAPRLLESLGCSVTVLGGKPDGQFEHEPEPTEQNLRGFCDVVRQSNADLGFAVDPDADRLAIVDGTGAYIGEEYTLALAIQHVAAKTPGTVVINSSTSRVSEDVAKAAGCDVVRTKVGEVHVAERMKALGAVLGGEGNGGVIDPRVGFGRDSAIGMALVLELLAGSKHSLKEIVADMPRYEIRKEKYTVDRSRLNVLLDRLKEKFADGQIDEEDGLRVDWKDSWVQVRASNTEPIIRVIAEGKGSEQPARLCNSVHETLQEVSPA